MTTILRVTKTEESMVNLRNESKSVMIDIHLEDHLRSMMAGKDMIYVKAKISKNQKITILTTTKCPKWDKHDDTWE